MRPLKMLLPVSVALLLTFGCKKKSTDSTTPYACATCVRTPQALAANDNSSKGIYKGVVIGSTGTIMFDLANNGTTLTALMVIDGVTVNLTSSVTWNAGQSYIAPFTGTINGQAVSITFSVGATGGTPTVVTSSIPGHPNAAFTVVKELSSSLVEGFEGTYSTTRPETGTFNVILSHPLNKWGAVARKTGDSTINHSSGYFQGNNIVDSSNNAVLGTISGDNISGSFVDNSNNTVTITGHRTL